MGRWQGEPAVRVSRAVLSEQLLALRAVRVPGQPPRAEALGDDLEHRDDVLFVEPIGRRRLPVLRAEQRDLILHGCVRDGEHFRPREPPESFRDLPRSWQARVRGAAFARGVKGALRDRLGLRGGGERGNLAHAVEELQTFLRHVSRFAATA